MPRHATLPPPVNAAKKVLKKARGYFGNKSRLFRYAKDAVDRGEVYAYAHRRVSHRVPTTLDRPYQCSPAVRKVCVTENLSTD